MPTEFQTGHKETDNAAGIFHYAIGRDRGLVKTFN